MSNFFVTINAVLPMFLLILLGMFLKKRGYMSETTVSEVNKVVFTAFLPCLLFNSIYHTSLTAMRPSLMIFAFIAILLIWLLTAAIVCAAEKSPARRGAMIQGIYRSNYTLFGIPLIINLFGSSQAGIASLMIAVILPLYNILAVLTLELFRSHKIHPGNILPGILKNPLIIGSVIGIIFTLLQINLPAFLEVGIESVSSLASPLALIIIGASLKLKRENKNPVPLTMITIGRLIAVPGLALPAAVFFGFSGIELAVLVSLFASPTAISAYPMAVMMNSDGDLTAEAIVFTTLFSCVTIFGWIFGLMQFGLL